MRNFNNNKYLKAKDKVDKLKAFYQHLMAYIIVNIGISVAKVVRNMNHGETFQEAFLDYSTFGLWVLWGIGLAIHAFATFGMDHLLGKNWEEKRIQKYMKDEEENLNF